MAVTISGHDACENDEESLIAYSELLPPNSNTCCSPSSPGWQNRCCVEKEDHRVLLWEL